MRVVGVPLGLPRHLRCRRSRKRAEIAGRHFAVEHLERFARSSSAHARLLGAYRSGCRQEHSPSTKCPAGIVRQTARASGGVRNRDGTSWRSGRLRQWTLPNTASICVGWSALNFNGAGARRQAAR